MLAGVVAAVTNQDKHLLVAYPLLKMVEAGDDPIIERGLADCGDS